MLSIPQPRKHLHQRAITLNGFAREDGLWDIEARLVDTKSHTFTTGNIHWAPGQAIHDMSIRLTVNAELEIKEVEVSMDKHPNPECLEVIPPMDELIGSKLGKGWRKTIDLHLGGLKGCTHLRELLVNMATAAFQAVPGALFNPDDGRPPLYLGACKSWDFDGPAVLRHYPKFYQWKTKS